MTDTIAYIHRSLEEIYPRSEINSFIRLIMERVCGLPPYKLLLGKDTELSDTEKTQIQEIVERLKNEEPLQYILGEADFYGLLFKVTPSVLIPRPETEELVDLIIKEQLPNKERPLRLMDIGTGSGCIAVTLSKEVPRSAVTAWDISGQALALARENSMRLEAEVQFEQHDVIQYQPDEKAVYDAIVSNPPYVLQKEQADMERNVLDWEPGLALFVPDDDPLLFYRRIAWLGLELLKPVGRLFFEINRAYGQPTVDMLLQAGYSAAEVKKDISGNDRIVIAER